MIFFQKTKIKKITEADNAFLFLSQKLLFSHWCLKANLKWQNTMLPMHFLENKHNISVIKKLDHKKIVGKAFKKNKRVQPIRWSDSLLKFNPFFGMQKSNYSTLIEHDKTALEDSDNESSQNNTSTAPKRLKAHFRHVDPKSILKGSKCLMTLSIGQKIHYGEYLAATLHEVEKIFSECIFVVGDTLQRHTRSIVLNQEPETLRAQMRKEGDEWIEQNVKILTQLNIPWKIIRWDTLLQKPIAQDTLVSLRFSYNTDQFYKNEVDKNIDEFIMRAKNRDAIHCNENIARQRCLDYLLEECSIMFIWTAEGCRYELYPNGRVGALQATYEHFIAPTYGRALLTPLSMRFKKVGQSQTFQKARNDIPPESQQLPKTEQDLKEIVKPSFEKQKVVSGNKLSHLMTENSQQHKQVLIRQFHGTQEILADVQQDNIESKFIENPSSSFIRPQ